LGSLDEGNSSLIVQCGGETVLSAADKKMKKDFAGTRKSFTLGSLDEGSSSFDNPKQKS